MRTHGTTLSSAAALVAVGLALAGCGSDATTAGSSSPATSSSSSSSPTNGASTSSAAPTPSQADANPTIADYIRDNGITETPVKRGDPGTPRVDMPLPDGWVDAAAKTPPGAYGAIVFADPAMSADPPSIVSVMSRLTGDVDPAEIFTYAPGELKNLPGYEGAGQGGSAKLGGFDAYQIGATYVKNGTKTLITQKTVTIPAADGNGIFVLQLNASGTEDQINPLTTATSMIDEQTTITP